MAFECSSWHERYKPPNMTTHIALLRAINVGGHNLISMPALLCLFEDLGLHGARSLLQSGNVVFDGGGHDGADLEHLLEARTKKLLRVQVDYMVRRVEELAEIAGRNPFRKEAQEDPGHLVVLFLKAAPKAARVNALRAAIHGREIVRMAGRQSYIIYPDGIGRSKLTTALIEDELGVRGTGRNWNTVLKLLAGSEAHRLKSARPAGKSR